MRVASSITSSNAIRCFLSVIVAALFTLACASTPSQKQSPADETKQHNTDTDTATHKKLTSLLETLVSRIDEIERRQRWIEDADRQWLTLQAMTAEAQQYERILEVIGQSSEPSTSQIACLTSLELLASARSQAEHLLLAKKDIPALSQAESEIDEALMGAKRCVVNYGEVAFVYFNLDNYENEGRTIPHGLNPSFSEENDLMFAKLRKLCSRSGVIHLYGYSCDLGTFAYDETLAYERAVNLKSYITKLLLDGCHTSSIRVEANLGGVIELIDPRNNNPNILKSQRERNRVVAAFMFNQD